MIVVACFNPPEKKIKGKQNGTEGLKMEFCNIKTEPNWSSQKETEVQFNLFPEYVFPEYIDLFPYIYL